MERNHIIAVAVVLTVLVAVVVWQVALPPLALYSYAKRVPIQIGYNDAQDYWVLSAVVDETTAFKLVLDDGTSESVSSNEEAKAKSEVGVLVNPLQPYSKTNMDPANIKWTYQGIIQKQEKSPAFDINDAGWLTTAVYELGVYKNGFEETSQRVEVDYQKPKVVSLETSEGTVTVNNLGILPQGVEVPSGDLILVYDPNGKAHIFNKADFINMISVWNNRASTSPLLKIFSWKDVWNTAIQYDFLPQDVHLVHVSDVEITEENKGIILTYFLGSFAGDISIYVPDELADTVIVRLFAPEAKIVKVDPDPLPPINEGEKTAFSVTVQNVGTEGTITVSVSSDYYSFTALDSSGGKNFEANETATFSWEAHALNVEGDRETTTKIFAQGRGGSDTYVLKGTILNVEGYTPTIPDEDDDTVPTPTPGWWGLYWWVVLIVAIIVIVVIVAIYMKNKS